MCIIQRFLDLPISYKVFEVVEAVIECPSFSGSDIKSPIWLSFYK